jgi:dUTP pyrophosphatase
MLRLETIEGKEPELPTKSYKGDAGWDFRSMEHKILQPGECYRFMLGFRIIGERGKVYITHARSSLAINHGLDVIGDIIDNGYRGEISIVLQNTYGFGEVEINKGDKIGQILIQDVDDTAKLIVDSVVIDNELPERLDQGTGSSGE